MKDLPQLDTDFGDLLDFDLNIDIPGFTLEMSDPSDAIQTDMVSVRRYPRPTPNQVKYEHAAAMAASSRTVWE